MTEDRENILTIEKEGRQERFLDAYRRCGVIARACKIAEVSRSTVNGWRATEEFEARFKDAHEDAVDEAREENRRKALGQIDEPVLYKGEPVWKRDPHTGTLLLDDDFMPIPYTQSLRDQRALELYLKANADEYKDPKRLELTGAGGGPIQGDFSVKINLVKAQPRQEEPDDTQRQQQPGEGTGD